MASVRRFEPRILEVRLALVIYASMIGWYNYHQIFSLLRSVIHESRPFVIIGISAAGCQISATLLTAHRDTRLCELIDRFHRFPRLDGSTACQILRSFSRSAPKQRPSCIGKRRGVVMASTCMNDKHRWIPAPQEPVGS